MHIVRQLSDLPPGTGPSVVAIGNFDGMHLGHRRILRFLIREARRSRRRSVGLTFHPHPRNVLSGGPVPLIQTLDQRLEALEEAGIDIAVVIPFDRDFARRSAADFIGGILVNTLNAEEVIVGENFVFGRNREGTIETLKSAARIHGFKVFSCASVLKAGSPVSSSQIRSLLFEGRISEANRLLTRPYSISGWIISGRSQGRSLGFPTANVRTDNEILPPGVFITRTELENRVFRSVTNIGSRPTFGGGEISAETHLIDFGEDLYGRPVRIEFLKKLRDELRFPGPSELAAGIREDLAQARAFFLQPASRRTGFRSRSDDLLR